MKHLTSPAVRQPPAELLQHALAEGRTMDAADLLAEWAQTQHTQSPLDMEQQAHLLHSCYDLLRQRPFVHAGLWQLTQSCLQQATRRI